MKIIFWNLFSKHCFFFRSLALTYFKELPEITGLNETHTSHKKCFGQLKSSNKK